MKTAFEYMFSSIRNNKMMSEALEQVDLSEKEPQLDAVDVEAATDDETKETDPSKIANESEPEVEEDGFTAGDVSDFISSKKENLGAKVVVKESGKEKVLKDIIFENGKCIIDIG